VTAEVSTTYDRLRSEIVGHLRRLAAENGGRAPGFKKFEQETGIGYVDWYGKCWARWGDAVAEAGLTPNQLTQRSDANKLLADFVEAARHYGRLPTSGDLKMYGRIRANFPTDKTFANVLGLRAQLVENLRAFVSDKPDYADVAAMLPIEPIADRTPRNEAADGFVYLIQYGEYFKVGRSADLERRVKEIKIALPDTGVLAHSIRTDDPPGIEAYWHRRFADKRANGEWFKLTRADIAAFKRRKFQ
jgi:hypothetical protein